MSPSDEILCSIDERIATVTLNRPALRNAVDARMVADLHAFLDVIERDAGVRALVVRGEGPAFCAGLDLANYGKPARPAWEPEDEVIDLMRRFERLPRPTIAMVHGAAFAGGCLVALHCDLRVASTAARFAMPLARLGLVVPFPMVQKLVEEAGARLTRYLLLTGEPISAEEAHAAGMIHKLAAPADLEKAAYDLARTVAANAPLSLRAMKSFIARALPPRERTSIHDIEEMTKHVRDSSDAREGLRARVEKRVPVFRGE